MSCSWPTTELACSIAALLTIFSRAAHSELIVLTPHNVTASEYACYGSFFGPLVGQGGLDGYVVYAEPAEACTPILDKSHYVQNITHKRKWISLIKRGDCAFGHKVLMAQNAGYDAAIVHNVGSQELIHMSTTGEGEQIVIPSVFIGEHDGLRIKKFFQWDSLYHVLITEEFPVINLNTILVPFAVVLGVTVLVCLGFTGGRWYREWRHHQLIRLPRRELRKLPKRRFKKEDRCGTCAICLEDFLEGEKVRVLPCDHLYHPKCVDPWLLNNRRICPTCKRRVIPGDASDDEEPDPEAGAAQQQAPPPLSPLPPVVVIPPELPGGVSSSTTTGGRGRVNRASNEAVPLLTDGPADTTLTSTTINAGDSLMRIVTTTGLASSDPGPSSRLPAAIDAEATDESSASETTDDDDDDEPAPPVDDAAAQRRRPSDTGTIETVIIVPSSDKTTRPPIDDDDDVLGSPWRSTSSSRAHPGTSSTSSQQSSSVPQQRHDEC